MMSTKKVKIKIDQKKCIACGTCVAIDPKHFAQADDGKAVVIGADGSKKAENVVEECGNCKDAAESCSVESIKISSA